MKEEEEEEEKKEEDVEPQLVAWNMTIQKRVEVDVEEVGEEKMQPVWVVGDVSFELRREMMEEVEDDMEPQMVVRDLSNQMRVEVDMGEEGDI